MNKKMSLVLMAFLGSSLMIYSAQLVIQSGQTIGISGNGLSEMAFYSADKQWSVIPIADAAYEVAVNQKESAQSLAAKGKSVGFSIDWSNKQLMSYYYSFGQYIQVAFNPNAPTYLNGNGPWSLYVNNVDTGYLLNTNVSDFFIKILPPPVVFGGNIYMNGNPLTGFAYSNGGIGGTFNNMVNTLKVDGQVQISCYEASTSYCNWVSNTGVGYKRKFPNASNFTISINNNSKPIYTGVFGNPTTVTIYAGSPPLA